MLLKKVSDVRASITHILATGQPCGRPVTVLTPSALLNTGREQEPPEQAARSQPAESPTTEWRDNPREHMCPVQGQRDCFISLTLQVRWEHWLPKRERIKETLSWSIEITEKLEDTENRWLVNTHCRIRNGHVPQEERLLKWKSNELRLLTVLRKHVSELTLWCELFLSS